jgi:hypothetical protein
MKKLLCLFLVATLLHSCKSVKKENADFIVYNANIYCVDSLFNTAQAVAIKNGKIMDVGSTDYILSKYISKDTLNANGNTLLPGFIDAHCHFYNYGLGLQEANLVGTKSFQEVLQRLVTYANTNKDGWLIGRGWDQNDWMIKNYPDNNALDSLFPDRPVFIKRIDGHAALANTAALQAAGIRNFRIINGGSIEMLGNKPSGVLIDNAVELVEKIIPSPSIEKSSAALISAEKKCFAVGLTTVDDAGLNRREIDLIDGMQKQGALKMRIYAMISANKENFNYYFKVQPYKTERLNVRSFKFYADGALGSRGACLKGEYADKPGWKGFLLEDLHFYDRYAHSCAESGYQMNTHCIGDSANQVIVDIISEMVPQMGLNHRWRIEHAQVVREDELVKYQALKIIPSVQPTHATSDMYWAKDRLGETKIKKAYAYKEMINYCGKIALGTDFPVEDINPLLTFYAAVVRKDKNNFPELGFQPENKINREDALRGMTTWAAYSNFEENEKGQIKKNYFADFVIIDKDIMKCAENEILNTKVIYTFVNGEKVFQYQ